MVAIFNKAFNPLFNTDHAYIFNSAFNFPEFNTDPFGMPPVPPFPVVPRRIGRPRVIKKEEKEYLELLIAIIGELA